MPDLTPPAPSVPPAIDLFGRSFPTRDVLAFVRDAGYGSHRVLLYLALSWFRADSARPLRTVYEFGMGEGSTPFIAAFCAECRATRVHFDSDRSWAARFFEVGGAAGPIFGAIKPHGSDPSVVSFQTWDDVPIGTMGAYSIDVAFVDHAPGDRRRVEVARLRDKATLVVVHDTELDGAGDYQLEPEFARYRYRLDDHRGGAGTTIVSDVVDVSQWAIFRERIREVMEAAR